MLIMSITAVTVTIYPALTMCCTYILSSKVTTTVTPGRHHDPHFLDGEMEAWRLE